MSKRSTELSLNQATLATAPKTLQDVSEHLCIIVAVLECLVDAIDSANEDHAVTLLECGLYPLLAVKEAVEELTKT